VNDPQRRFNAVICRIAKGLFEQLVVDSAEWRVLRLRGLYAARESHVGSGGCDHLESVSPFARPAKARVSFLNNTLV
jgi:hypothetical protein